MVVQVSMENLVLGMRYPQISQGCNAYIPSKDYYSKSDSHMGYNALDIKGMDTGKDAWRAKNRYKCIAIYDYASTGFYNTIFFTPCDEGGEPVKVMTPCHGAQYVTIKMTHDNSVRVKLNGIYDDDFIIYMEGTMGLGASGGNHIHLEACLGLTTTITKVTGSQYYNGKQYILKDGLPLNEVFFLLKGYTMYEPSDNKRYPWKWVDSVKYTGKIVEYTKNEKDGVYGVDLSQFDAGAIDFEKLSKVAKYAILRVGFGADKDGQHDTSFFDFCRKCDEYGIKKGAYIYSYAETEQEARNEANHIIRLCNEAGGNFPIGLFLDMENSLQTKLTMSENTRNVLAYIQEIWKTNYKAGFYSYTSFCDAHVDMSQIVGNAIVWVANFGPNDGAYHSITTNYDYDIRQYTSTNKDKDFSTREGLDQNLHFGYANYVKEPEPVPEPEPEHPGTPDYDAQIKDLQEQINQAEKKLKKIDELSKKIDELNASIDKLNQESILTHDKLEQQDKKIEELDGRLLKAGQALLGEGE